jgi:hypothetical protein
MDTLGQLDTVEALEIQDILGQMDIGDQLGIVVVLALGIGDLLVILVLPELVVVAVVVFHIHLVQQLPLIVLQADNKPILHLVLIVGSLQQL